MPEKINPNTPDETLKQSQPPEAKYEFNKAEKTRIQVLNDMFRQTFLGGQVVLTQGIASMNETLKSEIFEKVRSFSDFNKDNDPHGEHDFGIINVNNEFIYWKIDYYDLTMEWHSPDKSDPKVTKRVLTIMLAIEY